jgi:nucleoside phosphorylase
MSEHPPEYLKYTVGWICVKAVEKVAAEAMLDSARPHLQYQHPNPDKDSNIYTLGRISDFNVVITFGKQGISNATQVATQMMNMFPSIKVGLMVGIGGGLPRGGCDIRLGDVVVSQPDATYGGVVHYGFGKDTEDGFELAGHLNAPPEWLQAVVREMEARQMAETLQFTQYISALQQPTFQHPGEQHDKLFKANYSHDNRDSCDECDDNMKQRRDTREHSGPYVYFGTIASADRVVKRAEIRQMLIKKHKALCVEMEAAGLMNTRFPCVVIRGICDYADSHKNDRWQGYAAATASAYAKALLLIIRELHSTLTAAEAEGESTL